MAEMIRSVSDVLAGGEFKDTTGLAEREEVNGSSVREHRVYHGSGADFDAFDHSHMGEGEGAQAYGWGTYVTEVEGIGRTYAVQNSKYAREYPVYNGDSHGLSEGRVNEILEVFLDGVSDETYILRAWDDAMQWYSSRKDDDYAQSLVRDASLLNPSDISIAGSKTRNLYTVEIPDDNGSNYLDWDAPLPKGTIPRINEYLREKYGEDETVSARTCKGLYHQLERILGGDKKASQALAELGYTGIKYPADYRRGGRKDGAKNYVIFNENDAKITDHTRFLRTADGEVYGLVKDGRIYLDPKVATSETAVHEYTHLWGDMLRRKDPEQWSHTVKELKNSVLWEEVKELYPELKTDDEIADEVLSTFSGRRGAERLREEARRVADGEGGVFTKAKAIETLERVKEAIARFWEGVAKMFGINCYRSAEELADMAMKDLLDSKNPMKDESGMRKRGEVGETLATSGTYFSGGGLLEAGLKGVIDPKVADRVSQNLEERTRAMGSRVEKRMADVAQKLEGKELSMEQKAVVDVFSGKSDNQKFSVEREDGKKVSVVVRKGTETSAGTKHSLYRHYNTNVGTITTDDILLIPQIIKEGEIKRIRKGNEQYVEYTQKIGDKKLTTLMQIVNGKEVFNNFYSNKKGSELPASRNAESIDNTPEGAHNINSEPSAKVEDKSESPKLFGEEIIDDGKKGSDSIDRSVRENPKSEDKPRLSRKPGESIFDYASRVSDSVDRSVRERVSARDEYEKKVKSKGFQTKEALQNSMLGLQEFMFAIDHASGNKRYIEDIPDFENPILGENRLSSVNKEEMHQVAKTQFKPLMSAVAKLSGNGKESGELYDYMFAKHGLERDAVMRQREAQKEFDKYQKAHPKGTKTIEDFVASLEGKDYAGLTAVRI